MRRSRICYNCFQSRFESYAMSFTGPIGDRLEIRELQEMYADAVNRRNLQDWLQLWTKNGVWIVAGKEYAGIEEMATKWKDFYAGYNLERGNLTRFFSSTPGAIVIEAEQAVARVYLSLLIADGTSKEATHIYASEDQYLKFEGKWLLTRREARRIHPSIV